MVDGEITGIWDFEDPIAFFERMMTEQEKCDTKGHDMLVVIEKQWARQGQGVSSTFTIGDNFGFIKGVVTALRISHVIETPTGWQKYYGFSSLRKDSVKAKKDEMYNKAKQLYPKDNFKKSQADAVLIAYWGWKYANNQIQ